MWLILAVIPQVWEVLNGGEWDLMMLFVSLPALMVVGYVWGLFMPFLTLNRKRKKAEKHESD